MIKLYLTKSELQIILNKFSFCSGESVDNMSNCKKYCQESDKKEANICQELNNKFKKELIKYESKK